MWVLVPLFSKDQEVNAAQCHKSSMRRWRCAPCGKGTRCVFCQWCLCYCYKGRHKRSITNGTIPIYGEELVQYKKPVIELFEELESLIQNEEISNVEVVELYNVTSFALSEDCVLCNNTPEIEELRNMTRSIHEQLMLIMMSENITAPVGRRKKRSPSFISLDSDRFREVALESTGESLKIAHKIPETVWGKVDFNSTIRLGT